MASKESRQFESAEEQNPFYSEMQKHHDGAGRPICDWKIQELEKFKESRNSRVTKGGTLSFAIPTPAAKGACIIL